MKSFLLSLLIVFMVFSVVPAFAGDWGSGDPIANPIPPVMDSSPSAFDVLGWDFSGDLLFGFKEKNVTIGAGYDLL
ncbi:MAG: hypothetical protein COX41_06315, partial [Candidatus Omnitrophica bacterium CG23_combo_of_CG06-09_8_20_14_all_41_10]